jgi:predicted MPP superfamily phosphohydrolase
MRRTPLGLLIVIGVLLSVIGGTHGYFAARLVADVALPAPWSWLGYAAVWGLCALLFIHPTAERTIGPRAGRILAWPAYLWLGTCLYLLLGLGLSDLVMLALGWSGLETERNRALAVLGFASATMAIGMASALRVPAVRRVEVAIPDLPQPLDGYRIVQISDVHIGSILRRGFARRLAERCNALQADAIAITGDLVDGRVQHLAGEVAPLADLRARDGVFFVTGNHDHYSGADAWSEHLASLGIVPLRNRQHRIERGGSVLLLAGVDDLSSRRARTSRSGFDLDAALTGWDGEHPLVLLAHDPRTFDLARHRGVHLQLSGHTHDGQLWPFRYMVRLQTRWLTGLYHVGRSALYVSRGTGFWGPPMRILAPSEITELTLGPLNQSRGSEKT